jgi:signal transduction protein with GAF and PtsI domain
MTPEGLLAELAELAGATAQVLAPPELTGLCESVTATVCEVLGAAACSVAVIDEDADELQYVAASGAGAAQIVGTRLALGRGLAGWVAQSGQQIAVSDLGTDPRFARDVAESTGYVPSTLIAVPIESDESVLGVLTVLDRDAARAGAERDLELATAFAAQAATGLLAVEAFRSGGALLLRELSRAATEGTSLRAALAEGPAPDSQDRAVRRYSALLAELRQAGVAEQRLALDVLESLLAYVRAAGGSPRPR